MSKHKVSTDIGEPQSTKDKQPPKSVEVRPQQPFPVDLLPTVVRDYIVESAAARACDVSTVALPMLVTLAALIGTTRRIAAKDEWKEPAILWGAVIGRSGTMKSPGLDCARDKIEPHEQRLVRDHYESGEAYKIERLQFEKDLGQWKKTKTASNPPVEPVPPTAKRLKVDDTTIEALAPILQENPRGLLCIVDELRAWFGGMGAYQAKANGRDEAKWLELHAGRSAVVDRKTGRQRIYIPMAACSVVGTIQPGVLFEAVKGLGIESGLMARLLCVMPTPKPKRWTDKNVDPRVNAAMDALVGNLLEGLDHQYVNEEPRPIDLPLTTAATRRFARFVDVHGDETMSQRDALAAAWSKLEGAALRFALILHLCRWGSGEAGFDDRGPIDVDEIESGIELSRWFAAEAERVYSVIAPTLTTNKSDETADQDVLRLLEWIETKGGKVSEREIRRGLRLYRNKAEQVEKDCQRLVDIGRAYWDSRPKLRLICIKHTGDTGDSDTSAENPSDLEQVSPNPGSSVAASVATADDSSGTSGRHFHEKTKETDETVTVATVATSVSEKRRVVI